MLRRSMLSHLQILAVIRASMDLQGKPRIAVLAMPPDYATCVSLLRVLGCLDACIYIYSESTPT
jgi:hypothetical protein